MLISIIVKDVFQNDLAIQNVHVSNPALLKIPKCPGHVKLLKEDLVHDQVRIEAVHEVNHDNQSL